MKMLNIEDFEVENPIDVTPELFYDILDEEEKRYYFSAVYTSNAVVASNFYHITEVYNLAAAVTVGAVAVALMMVYPIHYNSMGHW